MDNAIDRRINLINKVIEGKLSYRETKKEVERLESDFGEEAFLPYNVKKRSKPWDKKYLEDLRSKGRAGAASKEYILHLAEVTDEVESKKKSSNMLISIIAFCIVIAGIIGVIIAIKSK